MTASDLAAAVKELRKSFGDHILEPGNTGYDQARKIHNGLIDKRPKVIARCRSGAEVAKALKAGRSAGLEISVRGGGHNVGGRAVTDGGLMIDLSLLKDARVDPKKRIARAGAGVNWAEFNAATMAHGLATTGGVISTTGIAGLTLGGGLGWLMGLHGMAVDNLMALELVTADGRVLTVNAKEDPDLFWAVRGGGGNFGVATWFEYRLHPRGPVTGGLVAHPLSKAREVLRLYRDLTTDLPDHITLFAGLLHAPDGSGAKLAAIVVCDAGSGQDDGVVRRLKEFGPPAMDMVGPMEYPALNSMLDGGFPPGALNYWKSSFLSDLSDDAIDMMIKQFTACPAPMGAVLLEHFHGAATRVGASDTAFPHRRVGYNLLVISEWLDPAQTPGCMAWGKSTYAAMAPFVSKLRYVNYLGDDEGKDAAEAAYGPNYRRLRELKSKYDPDNVFRLNQNIPPLAKAK